MDVQQQALEFVNRVLKTSYTNFFEDLKSGIVLCELVNEVTLRTSGRKVIPKINKMSVAFQQMENISEAIKAMRLTLHISDKDIFTTANLYQRDNLPQVAHAILQIEKVYNASAPPSTPSANANAATFSAPSRPAPSLKNNTIIAPPSSAHPTITASPTAPTRTAPAAPPPAAAPTPRASAPRPEEDAKISSALAALETQKARWLKEREEFEKKIAQQEQELTQAKQREAEKNKLLTEKENLEIELRSQHEAQLMKAKDDYSLQLAQKALEVEKERSTRDLELKNQLLHSTKHIEQLSKQLQDLENDKAESANNQNNASVEFEAKYQAKIEQIRAQLLAEKEEALLKSKVQQDRERMDAEKRAIESLRAESEQQIQRLKAQADADLQNELDKLKLKYEEEMAARAAGTKQEQSTSRQRSQSLVMDIEAELAIKKAQLEHELRQQMEKELDTVKSGIELRVKSEEAHYRQREEQLRSELEQAQKNISQEKAKFQAELDSLKAASASDNESRVQELTVKLQQKDAELKINDALRKERDEFASQQSAIAQSKKEMEEKYKVQLNGLEATLEKETQKLKDLEFMLDLKTKENDELRQQQNTHDDAELAKIKQDMALEMERLRTDMESKQAALVSEQQQEKVKNDKIQTELEALTKQLDSERAAKSALEKQVQESRQKITKLEATTNEVVATKQPQQGPSSRETELEAEVVQLKKAHQAEIAEYKREIEALKRQLAEAKSTAANAVASPESSGAPSVTGRPPHPMAAMFAKGGGEQVAASLQSGSSDDAPVSSRPPHPMAAAMQAGGAAAPAGRPPMSGGLLGALNGGGVKLKKVTPGDAPKPAGAAAAGPVKPAGGPMSLTDALKGGVSLRKTEPVQKPAPKAADPTDMASVAARMAKERAERQAAGKINFPK